MGLGTGGACAEAGGLWAGLWAAAPANATVLRKARRPADVSGICGDCITRWLAMALTACEVFLRGHAIQVPYSSGSEIVPNANFSARVVLALFIVSCALAMAGTAKRNPFRRCTRFNISRSALPPYAPLYRDSRGNLYGATNGGGDEGAGVVFKLSTTGKVTVLHSSPAALTAAIPAEAWSWTRRVISKAPPSGRHHRHRQQVGRGRSQDRQREPLHRLVQLHRWG